MQAGRADMSGRAGGLVGQVWHAANSSCWLGGMWGAVYIMIGVAAVSILTSSAVVGLVGCAEHQLQK